MLGLIGVSFVLCFVSGEVLVLSFFEVFRIDFSRIDFLVNVVEVRVEMIDGNLYYLVLIWFD